MTLLDCFMDGFQTMDTAAWLLSDLSLHARNRAGVLAFPALEHTLFDH